MNSKNSLFILQEALNINLCISLVSNKLIRSNFHHEEIMKLLFQALALCQSEYMKFCSDEGLTLEMPALLSLHGRPSSTCLIRNLGVSLPHGCSTTVCFETNLSYVFLGLTHLIALKVTNNIHEKITRFLLAEKGVQNV